MVAVVSIIVKHLVASLDGTAELLATVVRQRHVPIINVRSSCVGPEVNRVWIVVRP